MTEPRVLVVDDNLDTLVLYTTYLSLEGFLVTAASNVAQALALSGNGVDAVATDLAMPGMDGAQLIREMRASRTKPPVPIVVVTGHANARVEAELAEIGSCRLLRKPCELSHLAAVLRSLAGTCVHDCARCANRQRAAYPGLPQD
jgi:DNA-binding response OmpR family regulator